MVDTDRLCFNCFREREGQEGPCPRCGYDPVRDAGRYPLALRPGSVLNGQYIVGRVLGQGGFGITYLALDHVLGLKVAIKEFLPESMATRMPGTTLVTPYGGEKQENFAYGAECFLDEARVLAKFIGNPNIVAVKRYFAENNTAYFVMDYIEGVSFKSYIKNQGGRVDYRDALRVLLPVMDALAAVHREGIVHRDVAPDNIYLTGDGGVKLLDFGAARYSLGDRSRSLDVILKAGYAPKEQYTRKGRQGPYTDVYSLAACFYAAVTGYLPPESLERLEADTLIPISGRGVCVPPGLESAVLKGLAVRPEDRFQSMDAFRAALEAAGCAQAQPPWAPPAPEPTAYAPPAAPCSPSGFGGADGPARAGSRAGRTGCGTAASGGVPPAPSARPKTKAALADFVKAHLRPIVFGGVACLAVVVLIAAVVQLAGGRHVAPQAVFEPVSGGGTVSAPASPAADPLAQLTQPAMGNTAGNISNMGLAAEWGGWIYYSDMSGRGYLCRAKDGEAEVLTQDNCSYLNVLDGWVYYRNDSDSGAMYRIRTDGTQREKLVTGDCSYITVTEDWIYYIAYVSADKTGHLMRLRTDLSGAKQTLNEDCKRMALDGDWIYYLDGANANLYKIQTDGRGRALVTDQDVCYALNVEDGWIYYQNGVDGDTLYRIRPDGTGREQVLAQDTEYLNVSGGWVYYALDVGDTEEGSELWRVRTDGSGAEKLADTSCLRLNVAGGWLYFVDYGYPGLRRIPLAGGAAEAVEPLTRHVFLLSMAQRGGQYALECLEDMGVEVDSEDATAAELSQLADASLLSGAGGMLVFGSAFPQDFVAAMAEAGGAVKLQPKNWEEYFYACGVDETLSRDFLAAFEAATADVHVRDLSVSGGTYSGYVEDGRPEGWGVKEYSEDGCVYAGMWASGRREGQGTLTFPAGDKYVGAWAGDKYNGYGVYTWPDGQRYEGQFVDNMFQGQGTVYYPDGTSISGTFENDKYLG